MHIGEKISSKIQHILRWKYSIIVNQKDWKYFTKPLALDEKGKVDRLEFECRQEKSKEIIEKILQIHGKDQIMYFIGILAAIEPKIQALQPWVRDHVVHAINTFFLGVYILENIQFSSFEGWEFDYPFMWKLWGRMSIVDTKPLHDASNPE
jgi:hypothetical protein